MRIELSRIADLNALLSNGRQGIEAPVTERLVGTPALLRVGPMAQSVYLREQAERDRRLSANPTLAVCARAFQNSPTTMAGAQVSRAAAVSQPRRDSEDADKQAHKPDASDHPAEKPA